MLALAVLGFLAAPASGQTTTTTLEVNPDTTVAAGTAVTIQAEVSANGNAVLPGLVTFQDGTRNLGSAQLVTLQLQAYPISLASLTVMLGVGQHSIVGTFAGTTSPLEQPSTSDPLLITVTAVPVSTNTVITSYSTTYPYSLTASVNSTGPAPATGSVSFTDTTVNQPIGSAPLQSAGQTFLVNTGGGGSYTAVVADFNGDGIPDLATLTGGNVVSVAIGNPDGSLKPPQTYQSGASYYDAPTSIAVGDFNGDGFLDLAVTNDNDPINTPCNSGSQCPVDSVAVLLGNPNAPGTFEPQTLYPVGISPSASVAADFNGDGIPDLAVANYSGSVSILLGNPASPGTFLSQGNTYLKLYPDVASPFFMTAADFNNDGRQDLVILDSAEHVTVLLGDGTGAFPNVTGIQLQLIDPRDVQGLAVSDVNGDGIPDIVVTVIPGGNTSSPSPQSVIVLLAKGDGTFQNQTFYSTGTTDIIVGPVQNVVIADFNGDGIPDLATASVYNQTVSVLMGDPSNRGHFLTPTNSYFVDIPLGLVAADFNGDGAQDLMVFSQTLLNEQSATATLSNAALGIGKQVVTANYPGDPNHLASSGALALTTSQVATSLSLMATQGAGQSFTFAASLTPFSQGPSNTTGETITFYNGSAMLGTGKLNSQGQATLTVILPGGQYSVTASYTGDVSFVGSVSAPLTLTSPNTVILQITATQYVYPRQPEFYLQVALLNGKPSPTGTVTLYDGIKQIGSYALAASKRGLLIATLPNFSVGTHLIQANYGGDANYPVGLSDVIPVGVTPGPVNLKLGCSSTTLQPGQTLKCGVNASEYPYPVIGTVNYTITGLPGGPVALGKTGQAVITGVPPASGTITVTYPAQGNYEASGPVSLAFTVQ